MFSFDHLRILHEHYSYISQQFRLRDFFFVGGAIRDLLLGIDKTPHDIDMTLAGHPDTLWDTLPVSSEISRFRTEKYGTMTFLPKKIRKELSTKRISYEITPFRMEGGYQDLRHPGEIIWSNDLLADSRRRDFTINCLYWTCVPSISISDSTPSTSPVYRPTNDLSQLSRILAQHPVCYFPSNQLLVLQSAESIEQCFVEGKVREDRIHKICDQATYVLSGEDYLSSPHSLSIVIDPHGGLLDILQGKIRTVGSPADRFTEDALRILRALRFPNILNQHPGLSFDYDKATWTAMQHHAHLVTSLAKERIYQELVKVFSANNPFGYVSLLQELGILGALFPALANCKGDIQPVRYHPFDTFDHTLLTLHACQQINKNYLVKCAMLYHDVGKPGQYAYLREQQIKNPDNMDMSGYVHHTESSVPLAQTDFQNLGFSHKEIQEICRYIRRHHRPGEILSSNEDQRTKKIRSLISEAGMKWVLNLIDIAIADRMGQFNPMQPPAIDELKQMKQLVKKMHKEEGRFTMKDLAVNGNVLMQELKLSPGPRVGELLDIAFERVLTDVKKRNSSEKILTHLQSLPMEVALT